MRTLLISFIIGIAAGIIDVIPMILQKLDKRAILSAFFHYLFVAIIIVNIDLPGLVWWVEGGIISLSLSIPVLIIVSEKDKKVIPIISGMAVILGTAIGIAGHFFR